jgi:hypothetical protein
MKPALAGATAAVMALAAAAALLAPRSTPARDTALLPPAFLGELEPAVAACVLDRLGAAITESAALLLVQACARLVYAAAAPDPDAGGQGDDQLFVRCKVGGDPEWVEFRLVTRRQCAAAAGQVQD